jgi:hypothetical protein
VAHYIISYDLHNQRHYQPVWDKLGGCGAVRLLESLWVVALNDSASAIRDALEAVADGDDSIAVIELKAGSNWSTRNARKGGIEWLKAKIAS